mmetsp:Transcript_19863/g.62902  ORF Transcript_19863/g.62902 Transcript_19863/m.62902 type:complete len:339 (+) Transcript_19863:1766-2782(+)
MSRVLGLACSPQPQPKVHEACMHDGVCMCARRGSDPQRAPCQVRSKRARSRGRLRSWIASCAWPRMRTCRRTDGWPQRTWPWVQPSRRAAWPIESWRRTSRGRDWRLQTPEHTGARWRRRAGLPGSAKRPRPRAAVALPSGAHPPCQLELESQACQDLQPSAPQPPPRTQLCMQLLGLRVWKRTQDLRSWRRWRCGSALSCSLGSSERARRLLRGRALRPQPLVRGTPSWAPGTSLRGHPPHPQLPLGKPRVGVASDTARATYPRLQRCFPHPWRRAWWTLCELRRKLRTSSSLSHLALWVHKRLSTCLPAQQPPSPPWRRAERRGPIRSHGVLGPEL